MYFLGFSPVRTVRVVLCSVAVPSVGTSWASRLLQAFRRLGLPGLGVK